MLRLVCGNLNYSSWSVRPWLALTHAGAEFRVHDIGLKTEADWKERILAFSGAGKVPVLVDGSLSVHESLAIAEYVAELYPGAQLWPEDRQLRARGRAISCEMLSSFSALRSRMAMNLRGRAERAPVGPDVSGAPAQYSASLFGLPMVQELERLACETPAIPEYDASLGALPSL